MELVAEWAAGVKTIQVVMDEGLLVAVDAAAKREAVNRSQLIRSALREWLRKREIERLIQLECEGHERIPDDPAEHKFWMDQAVSSDD